MNATKAKSPFAHLTTEHRTRIGYTLYLDSYKKEFQFARELLTNEADMEIRMALFWAINERYVDMNNLKDAEFVFGPVADSLLKEVKEWAQEHMLETARKLMPFIDEETIRLMAAMLRQEKPVALQWRDVRAEQRKEQERAKRGAEQQRAAFNSQHQPAPEGTVKELAAKYGKSLSEIRRLKAEGLLHTLNQQSEAQA
jgi:primosomal protein N'